MTLKLRNLLAGLLLLGPCTVFARETAAPSRFPHVLVVTVDTLRSDRLSGYGYPLDTSPNIDRLMSRGVRFTQARTVEPLTNPALTSMLTSLHPHQHGATRNGVRPREGLASLPKLLSFSGYKTAAFVGNWTLRDRLSGLAEHFDLYEEVLTRNRWFGLFRSEATASDLTDRAIAWLDDHVRSSGGTPFFLWVHYAEPHAPYDYQEEFANRLGFTPGGGNLRCHRYDSEVAMVDHHVGRLLERVSAVAPPSRSLTAFTADHGESLGEHGHWGHGRHLCDVTLRIPMALTWPGMIRPGRIEGSALNIDLPPTIVGLLGLEIPLDFGGFDWSPVLEGNQEAPRDRVTYHQAHKGAVRPAGDPRVPRTRGLLEVGRVFGSRMESFRPKEGRLELHDLSGDPGESQPLASVKEAPSDSLREWLWVVEVGLSRHDDLPVATLDADSLERMRSLGYLD